MLITLEVESRLINRALWTEKDVALIMHCLISPSVVQGENIFKAWAFYYRNVWLMELRTDN